MIVRLNCGHVTRKHLQTPNTIKMYTGHWTCGPWNDCSAPGSFEDISLLNFVFELFRVSDRNIARPTLRLCKFGDPYSRYSVSHFLTTKVYNIHAIDKYTSSWLRRTTRALKNEEMTCDSKWRSVGRVDLTQIRVDPWSHHSRTTMMYLVDVVRWAGTLVHSCLF